MALAPVLQSLVNEFAKHMDKPEEQRLHQMRVHCENIVFSHLIDKYFPYLKNWWASYKLPLATETDKVIVIYETRILPHLEFHILNTCYFAQGWSLLIYCSPENHSAILNMLGNNRYRAIVHVLAPSKLTPYETYKSFYKSRQFWSSIPGKYALCAEADSYLRRALPDISEYDYVCAKWPWHRALPGGSGLTIRRVSAMLRICDELPDYDARIHHLDYWASEGVKDLNMKYNNDIFVEADIDTNAYGLHQWWTFFRPVVELKEIHEKYLKLDIPVN
jgi:hypothetical protein